MPQLDPQYFISQLFWLTVCFGALYLLLRYYLLPKAEDTIANRGDFITQGLEQAENMRHEIDELHLQLAEKMASNKMLIEKEHKATLSAESKKMKKSIHQLNKKLFEREMDVEREVYNTLRSDEAINQRQSCVIASIILSKILGNEVAPETLKGLNEAKT